ncbi:unnamed protein product [Parajaminaea phylloscopi]
MLPIAPIAGVAAAVGLAALYPTLAPTVKLFWPKPAGDVNVAGCQKIPGLHSCEQLWIDQGSGLLYAACAGSPEARHAWFPCIDSWNADKRETNEFLAVVDTRAQGSWESRTTKVKLADFPGLFGEGSFTSHGFGVWQDPVDANKIRIFLVNHRPSIDYANGGALLDNAKIGGNSTIELFETILGSDVAEHIRTYAHPLIRTPNDVEPAGPDSFYVSNDHHVKAGLRKELDMFLPLTDVAHCDTKGCKVALSKTAYANGIASYTSPETGLRTYYLSQTTGTSKLVLTPQPDNTLVIADPLYIPFASDNVYVSPTSGAAYFVLFPDVLHITGKHFKEPRKHGSPALVLKVEKNDPLKDREAFFGQKYKFTRIFESDDKSTATPGGITGVAVDEQVPTAYMGGIVSVDTWACPLTEPGKRVTY